MKKLLYVLALLALTSCHQRQTSLEFVQDNDLSTPNKPTYRIFANEYEPWTRLNMVTEDSMANRVYWGDVWIDDFGNLLRRENGCWENLTVACKDYGPGEKLDVWFVFPNGQQAFRTHIVPHPLMISQYGYNFYVEKDDSLAHNWRMVGTGFEPGETVDIVTYAGKNIFTTRLAANCEGEVCGDVDAWVEGKNTGYTRMDFYTWEGELSFTFPWGDNWFKWREKFVEEKRRQDKEYCHDLIYTNNYKRTISR